MDHATRPNQAARHPRTQRAAVKITDVAALAGVAPMTVSRVLNTPERVAGPTAARVREAIERLGYVPNLIAGGLSSRRSRMIAAIVPSIATPIFAACLQAFTDALEKAGYHVVLGISGYAADERAGGAAGGEDGLLGAILGRRPDGLLLTGTQRSPATRHRLQEAGIPVVEIWDESDAPTDMLVGFDHARVGAAVAEFFLEAGHRRFAMIGAEDPRAVRRRAGFAAAVRARGHEPVFDRALPAPASMIGGREAARDLMPLLGARTALFCSSDLVAAGAILTARAAGVGVPERLAVCGFGDLEIGRAFVPTITSVSVDGAAIGRLAAAALLRRLSGDEAQTRVIVPFRIERRESA